jgi:polyisoprenoid-binding protein YceI/rhodanese-related sulfurtransferase
MARIISPQELPALRSQHPELVVLDVRLADDFAAAHLPDALNQCVFEMVFLDDLLKKDVRQENPVCVYGSDPDSHEARTAAEKLERAGFRKVLELRDGLKGWRSAGYPVVESAATSPAPPVSDGRHDLDPAESQVVWVGRNLVNKHWGHVALADGHVAFRQGRPVSGEATLDLRRITCADLAGGNLHDVLIHHLESDDFFDVARHPTARFSFDAVEVCSDRPGCRNLKLRGELRLRGVTRPLVIEAAAGFTPEGKAALQSAFTIDRTEWGAIYGSGKFFRRLAGHLVNDEIELQLRIVTAAAVRQ